MNLQVARALAVATAFLALGSAQASFASPMPFEAPRAASVAVFGGAGPQFPHMAAGDQRVFPAALEANVEFSQSPLSGILQQLLFNNAIVGLQQGQSTAAPAEGLPPRFGPGSVASHAVSVSMSTGFSFAGTVGGVVVPEPGIGLLILVGGLGLIAARRPA